jgi:hypothetical protein
MFQRNQRTNELQNDAQQTARATTDRLAADMRNAVGGGATTQTIEKAAPNDLVFKTVSRTKIAGANAKGLMRERYCLDASDPSNGKIWLQTQSWTTATPPAIPATVECPEAEWGNRAAVADHVTNYFASALIDLVGVRTTLYVDQQVGQAPSETVLQSAITLRNANRRPVSAFTVSQVNGHVIVNASPSLDPEGDALTYQWAIAGGSCSPAQNMTYSRVDCANLVRGANVTFTLTVADNGGLTDTSSQVVTVQ